MTDLVKLPKFRKIYQLHIHHSWKPDYSDFNGINHIELFNQIKNYHIHHNKWNDIGYHYVVFPDGLIIKGRKITKTPASIKGYNDGAIAICMIGNFDKNDITSDQWYTTINLSAELITAFKIKQVFFHRDLNSHKTCPGLKIKKDKFMDDLNHLLNLRR